MRNTSSILRIRNAAVVVGIGEDEVVKATQGFDECFLQEKLYFW